ncbi:MAG TPA: hypothetical protein VGS01_05205 [Candidatus Limnocylindria bacterium]|jgi:hypothetical protein|nr:hypothetical protein [Candidatus Limnocylindria bacterium]
MTRSSRRTVLKSAAAGAAAIGLVGAGGRIVGSATAAQGSIETSSAPLVAYVSDARRGEIVVMVGTREIVRRDAGLVARLVAIAKEAGDVVAS